MGIKGIYKEIGPGSRVSLCKLAVDQLEQTQRPFRLAIDFSIWQFQVQAARGGANPAIRTLFYRLVRLLGLAIQPIFVFDGPHKPAFKRNKRSAGRGDVVATAMAKRLIRLFGFTTHDAPGEAEAECALLEQKGVVDAVLSEDVDAIMFGCRKTLRNWSAEGTKGSKTPTHVSMYDAAAVAAGSSGLDREGMVLVALMSGGDYLPEGVPGCGVKVACEAARAGFGRDLCRLKAADRAGLAAWKERLLHELRTNESGFFRTRHKALEIPESFPNMEVLSYYTHPVVSREGTVDRLKKEFPPERTVDVVGLRDFARETFDWAYRIGAVKLIRVLAPSLLVQQFLERYVSAEGHHDDLALKQKDESVLVKAISSKRTHFSTDATPELRISFVPADVVNLDLNAEPEEEVEAFGRTGIALNSDDEFDDETAELETGPPKPESHRTLFDPLQPDLAWIPATVAKLGVPLTVEDWEGKQRMKEQRVAAKTTRKPRSKKMDMPAGALDKYVKVTKSVADSAAKDSGGFGLGSSPPRISSQFNPPVARGRSKQSKKTSAPGHTQQSADINPWTLASSQASPRPSDSFLSSAPEALPKTKSAREPIVISSSPTILASPPARGASVTDSQTTPTRARSPQIGPGTDAPSPPPLFSPSPSPRKQRFPASDERAGDKSGAQPAHKARPFKRVKSGAKDTHSTSVQKSIKDFGRVRKKESPPQVEGKLTAVELQPIEILSDDEDFPFPPLKQPFTSSLLGLDRTRPAAETLDIRSDDDPFAPSPPRYSTQFPSHSRGAEDQHTPLKNSMSQEDRPPVSGTTAPKGDRSIIDDDAPPAVTQGIKEAGTAIGGTTKGTDTTMLYIPRTSLKGAGYYDVIEVRRDEADEAMAAHNDSSGLAVAGRREPARRRVWRQSDIEVLDLTSED